MTPTIPEVTMFPESAPAQLVGGEFDGDKGSVALPLPDRMFVWGCKTAPAKCPSNGIHWEKTLKVAGSVVYRLTGEEGGVNIYVHENVRLEPRETAVEETPAEAAR